MYEIEDWRNLTGSADGRDNMTAMMRGMDDYMFENVAAAAGPVFAAGVFVLNVSGKVFFREIGKIARPELLEFARFLGRRSHAASHG